MYPLRHSESERVVHPNGDALSTDTGSMWQNTAMPQIWIEAYDPARHSAPIEYRNSLGNPIHGAGHEPKNILVVSVASFTFQFFSLRQLRDCRAYFSQKTHPSSRLPFGAADHWEVQRWFERLPMYLLEDPKRRRVVRALTRALTFAEERAALGPI